MTPLDDSRLQKLIDNRTVIDRVTLTATGIKEKDVSMGISLVTVSYSDSDGKLHFNSLVSNCAYSYLRISPDRLLGIDVTNGRVTLVFNLQLR